MCFSWFRGSRYIVFPDDNTIYLVCVNPIPVPSRYSSHKRGFWLEYRDRSGLMFGLDLDATSTNRVGGREKHR